MPRTARKKSQTGIYHIMIRGVNKQIIFADADDARKFLDLTARYKTLCGFDVYAYCLMHNHVHLLVHEPENPGDEKAGGRTGIADPGHTISKAMQRLGTSYVRYFNRKYERTGHLFQDRFLSKPVESRAYLLNVLRYIHLNPVKAQICERPENFTYSSYNDYLNPDKSSLTDTDYILSFMPVDELVKYTNDNGDEDIFLPEFCSRKLTDTEVKKLLLESSDCKSKAEFRGLDRAIRDDYVNSLFQEGANVTQICRVTGLARTTIYRALK